MREIRTNNVQNNETEGIEFAGIKKSIVENIEIIKGLPLEEKIGKNEDIKKMITYYHDFTDSIEDRRIRIAETSWQSIAFSVAVLGIIASLKIIPLIKIPVLAILFLILLFSVFKLLEFRAQSGFRYPFLQIPKFSNKWKWFYYGNPYILKINSKPFFFRGDKKRDNNDQSNYLDGLNLFVKNYSQESFEDEIEDNIIQLYLLQVHNYYKNQFYLRLLRYDEITPYIIIIFLLLYTATVSATIIMGSSAEEFLFNQSF